MKLRYCSLECFRVHNHGTQSQFCSSQLRRLKSLFQSLKGKLCGLKKIFVSSSAFPIDISRFGNSSFFPVGCAVDYNIILPGISAYPSHPCHPGILYQLKTGLCRVMGRLGDTLNTKLNTWSCRANASIRY